MCRTFFISELCFLSVVVFTKIHNKKLNQMSLELNIENVKKNAENFQKFVTLSKQLLQLLQQDNKHVEFVMKEFVKFVIAKKRKNEFLDFAKYLFERSNLPMHLLNFILCENTITNTKEYLKLLASNGSIHHTFFITRFDPGRMMNVIGDDDLTVRGIPKDTLEYNQIVDIHMAYQYANIIVRYKKNRLYLINVKTTTDDGDIILYIREDEFIRLKQPQVAYSLLCILLLVNSKNEYIHIVCDLFRYVIKQTTMFDYVEFFKFLVEFDLYEMIRRYQLIISSICDDFGYYFEPKSNSEKIPDEDLVCILPNASLRVKKLYPDVKLYPQIISDITSNNKIISKRKVGITISSVFHVICKITEIPIEICKIIANYVHLYGCHNTRII